MRLLVNMGVELVVAQYLARTGHMEACLNTHTHTEHSTTCHTTFPRMETEPRLFSDSVLLCHLKFTSLLHYHAWLSVGRV